MPSGSFAGEIRPLVKRGGGVLVGRNSTLPEKYSRASFEDFLVVSRKKKNTHTHTHTNTQPTHTHTHCVELLASHQAPPQAADRGKLDRYDGYRGNKIPGVDQN